jgi:hypothetical protein
MSASNEYGDTKSTKFPYPFLENALLAEPYKTTTFSIANTVSGCEYSWSITDAATSDVIDSGVTDSSSFSSSLLTETGQYSLSVSEGGCGDSYSRTLDTTVGCFAALM